MQLAQFLIFFHKSGSYVKLRTCIIHFWRENTAAGTVNRSELTRIIATVSELFFLHSPEISSISRPSSSRLTMCPSLPMLSTGHHGSHTISTGQLAVVAEALYTPPYSPERTTCISGSSDRIAKCYDCFHHRTPSNSSRRLMEVHFSAGGRITFEMQAITVITIEITIQTL